MSDPQTPPPSRWQKFAKNLSPRALRHLSQPAETVSPPAEAHFAYRAFLESLSPTGKQSLAASPETPWPAGRQPHHFMLEAPDGELPVLKSFTSAEAVARRLKELDGKDVACFPFYGLPIPFSVAPNRVLLLPDDTAIQITPSLVMVDVMKTSVVIQDDGFLGPPALAVVSRRVVSEEVIESAAPASLSMETLDGVNAAADDDDPES